MEIRKFIAAIIKEYMSEINISSSEYVGQHSAPKKNEYTNPLYNIVNMFPDIYTENALKYYGGYGLDDRFVINQIKRTHNKPNSLVVIYRAVPNLNKDIDKKIKDLRYINSYKFKFGFFPMQNQTVQKLETDILDKEPSLTYDEAQDRVFGEINNMIDNLVKQKEKPIKINNGDWVTISKLYAKQHGESVLNNNYKIVKKTVKASQLYTDGNSIFEWGYNT